MQPSDADTELRFIHEVVQRTHRRVDPHAFHFVHWGAIVLVWYPLANYFQSQGQTARVALVGGVAVTLGAVLSASREILLARRDRLPAKNTFISRQVILITYGCLVPGALLSFLLPATGLLQGEYVPLLWGAVYANLAFMTGVVYHRDFLVSGIAILAGTLLAILFADHAGYILGPFMGIGMIWPGRRAEARVRQLSQEPA